MSLFSFLFGGSKKNDKTRVEKQESKQHKPMTKDQIIIAILDLLYSKNIESITTYYSVDSVKNITKLIASNVRVDFLYSLTNNVSDISKLKTCIKEIQDAREEDVPVNYWISKFDVFLEKYFFQYFNVTLKGQLFIKILASIDNINTLAGIPIATDNESSPISLVDGVISVCNESRFEEYKKELHLYKKYAEIVTYERDIIDVYSTVLSRIYQIGSMMVTEYPKDKLFPETSQLVYDYSIKGYYKISQPFINFNNLTDENFIFTVHPNGEQTRESVTRLKEASIRTIRQLFSERTIFVFSETYVQYKVNSYDYNTLSKLLFKPTEKSLFVDLFPFGSLKWEYSTIALVESDKLTPSNKFEINLSSMFHGINIESESGIEDDLFKYYKMYKNIQSMCKILLGLIMGVDNERSGNYHSYLDHISVELHSKSIIKRILNEKLNIDIKFETTDELSLEVTLDAINRVLNGEDLGFLCLGEECEKDVTLEYFLSYVYRTLGNERPLIENIQKLIVSDIPYTVFNRLVRMVNKTNVKSLEVFFKDENADRTLYMIWILWIQSILAHPEGFLKYMEEELLEDEDANLEKNPLYQAVMYLQNAENNIMTLEGLMETVDNAMEGIKGKTKENRSRFELDFDLNYINSDMNVQYLSERIKELGVGPKVLLYGESGSGKTEFVKYIAKYLNKELIRIDVSDFRKKYVGEGENTVKRLIEEAVSKDGVLLLDEADSIASSREDGNQAYISDMTNHIITELDKTNIPVFLTTNFADSIDKAVLRRIDVKIEFMPLTIKHKMKLFKEILNKASINYNRQLSKYNRKLIDIDLTVGMFRSVLKRMIFTKNPTIEDAYKALEKESKHCIINKKKMKLGFNN